MAKEIYGNVVGGSSGGVGKTLKLIDENGIELIGTIVDKRTEFTAGVNDVRKGHIFCNDSGMQVGEKAIPAYRTKRGSAMVPSGSDFLISAKNYDLYNYTQLQCMMTPFNDWYFVEKVVLDDGVYNTNSSVKLASVTKDDVNKTIKLNIKNDTSQDYFLYYFMYKEEN